MSTITVTYVDPTALADGSPIPPGDFVGVQVLFDNVLAATVAPGVQNHAFANVPPGPHTVILQAVDAQGVTGTPTSLTASVSNPLAPIGAVGNASITVS